MVVFEKKKLNKSINTDDINLIATKQLMMMFACK